MYKAARTIFIASLTLGVATGAAIAEESTEEERAPMSGIYKDRNNTLEVSGPGFGITGVSSSKKDSSPCKVSISERSFSGQGSPSKRLELNACPGKSTRAKETAQFDEPSVFVNGISVCMSEKLRHIKPVVAGIRLSGARVEGGTVTPLGEGSEVSFARRGCANWQEPVYCEDGQVATGLTTYFRKAKINDFQVVGLGLVCSAPA